MYKKLLIVTMLFVLVFSSMSLAADYKDEYTLSYNVGPSFPWGIGANYFADLVKERTDGRINIKPYGGSSLASGKQTSIFMMVRNGSVDMAMESTINWSSQIKELNLFNLPFFFDGYKEVDAVENGEAGQQILDKIERFGVVPIGWGENGFRQITNNKRAVHSPEDLSDLKYRVVGSKIFIDIFKELGSNPLTMNWGEATTGFQQGTVDGQENPTVGVLIPLKIWDFHEYMTVWDYLVDPLLLGINEDVFNSWTEEDQKIVRKAAKEALKFEKMLSRYNLDDGTAKQYVDKMIESGEDMGYAKDFLATWEQEDGSNDPLEYLEEQGMKVNVLTDEEKEAFIEKTRDVHDEWVKTIGEDLVEKAKSDMESVE
ncbi:MAG TPA: DctP family TRAP transporter solute-binding subunit [Halanaerobiales bacterium]|nr:DctP family TRAP transporter solute-binding subunit [Halanaerobiales bacterium]